MIVNEIIQFMNDAGTHHVRQLHMLAALSRTARFAVLQTRGLPFGCTSFHGPSSTDMAICLSKEASVPPVDWWDFNGNVAVDSSNASMTACELIMRLKSSWKCCTVSQLKLHHDDEVEEREQDIIVRALNCVCTDLRDLRLTNFCLRESDRLPVFTNLRALFLTGYDGSVAKWAAALNEQVERVEICDTFAFVRSSFASMTHNTWQRLILDNSNVTTSNLEQLRCRGTLMALSLIDCRKIDSLEADMFPQLRLLLLGRTPLSSDLLTGVEKCRHLKLINLGGCHDIYDINAFGALKELRELFVHETGVTNDGIFNLSACENLEKLNLGGCKQISNVNHLGSLVGLKELHLWSTRVGNLGIRGLSSCHSLTELILDDCKGVSDVSPLGHLPLLRWLSLIGTEVTGQGVKELIHCPKLETLALAGTQLESPPKLWRHEAILQYLVEFQ